MYDDRLCQKKPLEEGYLWLRMCKQSVSSVNVEEYQLLTVMTSTLGGKFVFFFFHYFLFDKRGSLTLLLSSVGSNKGPPHPN